ncbi:non-oxidative hydroxyarylic acid decarboxylases subunit D [Sodalis sp. C49]|uniref:non-oxidative hydroxyarylic acid decarboxylases subunit D n=1 Tax=Sodalis sp. C49 TaxID=3228929 RepID=UPI003965C4E9
MMICPRCQHPETDVLFESPVSGVFTVFQCGQCLYTWRSTEPPRRSDPRFYPQAFRLDPGSLEHAEEIPPVPVLQKVTGE